LSNVVVYSFQHRPSTVASNLQELEPSQPEAPAKSSVSSSKRILENEKYQELLGNSSLLKKIVQYGEEGRRPLNGQMVTIEYEAFPNENPTKLIDHNENLNFILGDGDVIQGKHRPIYHIGFM
jgi:hypothetical protein